MKPLIILAAAFGVGATEPADPPLFVGPQSIVASDGLKPWYRVAGQPDGVPVIYLHGGPGEGSQGFARTIGPVFERNLRMVYLDQRGAGHSEKPAAADRYTMLKIVADVETLRVHLGAPKVAPIGHSYGGLIAMEYAGAYPDAVTRVVLAGVVPDVPLFVDRECARLKTQDHEAYTRNVAVTKPGCPNCIPFEAYGTEDGRLHDAHVERDARDHDDAREKR